MVPETTTSSLENVPVNKSMPKFIKCSESSFEEEFQKTVQNKVQFSELIICDAGLTIQIIGKKRLFETSFVYQIQSLPLIPLLMEHQ